MKILNFLFPHFWYKLYNTLQIILYAPFSFNFIYFL